MAAAVLEQMRKQEAHLVMRKRVLARPQRFVPDLLRRGFRERGGDELVPHVGRDSAFGADASGERIQKVEGARYLPAPEIARSRAAPDVRGESRTRASDLACDLDDLFSFNAALVRGVLGRELRIDFFESVDERFERAGKRGPFFSHELFPVHPAANKLSIEGILLDNHRSHREQQRGFSAGPGRQPVVGCRCGV